MANDNVFVIIGKIQENIDHLQNRVTDENLPRIDRIAELIILLENELLTQQLETSVANLKALVEVARGEA